jgi:hypothetical protein
MIKEAVTSKKFITTIAGTITAAALKIGLDLPTADVATVLSPIVAYIFAQGWADQGKSAAKVHAVARVVTDDRQMNTEETVEAIKTT